MGAFQKRRDKSNAYYFAFTPAGTLVQSTGALTRQGCIDKLLKEAAHMPYPNWEAFRERGYSVVQVPGLSPE